ncbi:MAG: acetyl-CoA C-acetyltransferase [Proteobacteria bacterium]|nr:acetyl-CoA C-acetyltransferase [Pseudomonadota bacterium]NDC23147.1 acetyl-CoA C-acetyltransferase [Pseudomonadota bacterium]
MKEVVIVSAVRTPIGAYLGALKEHTAPHLGAFAIKEAVRQSAIAPSDFHECLMGNVLSAGLGQAPARQAAIFAGLPNSVRCTTVNRVCGSGLKTVMLATQMIQTGDAEVVIAGGMESMSRAPYLLDKAREGYRMGNGKLIDSMIHDGLWDAYHNNHMGDSAELCASEKTITRVEQDTFAKQSYQRALTAIEKGQFKSEIVPIPYSAGKEKKLLEQDEEPFRAKLDKFAELKPAFLKEGTITAANASSLSDGAAATVLCSKDYAIKKGLKILATIVAQDSFAREPQWFTLAPVGAIQAVLKKANKQVNEIDLYEINEAFSVVALGCMKELKLTENKVNVRGGAVALGHPIGASGTRILVTLIHSLIQQKKKTGIASLCIGGGEASALMVEAFH